MNIKPKPNLFLLHYAGGNFYSYNFIKPYLNGQFNFIPIELPGRGKRMREKLLFDKDLAVADVLSQILKNMNSNPFLIFGHSMGAYLGFQVVEELEKRNLSPLCFIASGNPGPNIKNDKQRYDLPKDEFISELKILGGTENEILKDDELFEFFEPVIRADFEVVEKEIGNVIDSKISTPIFACMGDKEKFCDQIQNWRQHTTGSFRSKLFEGNHFFIHNHAQEIAKLIRQCAEPRVMF